MKVRRIIRNLNDEQKWENRVYLTTFDFSFLFPLLIKYEFRDQLSSFGDWQRKHTKILVSSIAALERHSADVIKYDGTKEVIENFFLGASQKAKEEFFYNKGEEVKKILQEIEIPEIQEAKEKIKNGGLIKILDEEKEESLLYFYKNSLYEFGANYTDEEKELLILKLEDKERQEFERLKRKFLLTEEIEREPKRKPIPEEIRIAVWRRDSGQCAKCGSRKNLEYDHIIPVSKGGSNTVRNIELLCEECNRKKRDNIT